MPVRVVHQVSPSHPASHLRWTHSYTTAAISITSVSVVERHATVSAEQLAVRCAATSQ